MLEVEIVGVFDGQSHPQGPMHPVVKLRHEDRELPIVVGIPEAQAIQVGLLEEKLGRPMTHDLVCNILAGLRAELESVTIYKLENDTFYAHLNLSQKNAAGEIEQLVRVDSRPSDGIAIAVRARCPIYVAEEVMDLAGLETPSESESEDSEEPDEDDSED